MRPWRTGWIAALLLAALPACQRRCAVAPVTPPTWTATRGPGGGIVLSLGTRGDTLYAGTHGGGVWRCRPGQ